MSFYKGKRGLCCINYCSIPDENFEDHSAPPSPEEKDSGFFMLKKDSERRATLYRILKEDQDKVVRNLMESLAQVKPFTDASRFQGSHSLTVQPVGVVAGAVETEEAAMLMMTQQTYPRREKADPVCRHPSF